MMRRRLRGLTLIEIMVAISILSMVSVLIYGAFDGLSRGKKGLGRLNDRYHQGRMAIDRLARELSSAFVSQHVPLVPSLIRSQTVFVGVNSSPADRIDFTSFSHRRLVRDSHESDQNELSYFGSPDPAVPGKVDLARRESAHIDTEPRRGGEVNVIAEDIDLFDVKYLDPTTSQWLETWDTTQATGQPNRLPLQVKITLVLRGGEASKPFELQTKVTIPMTTALNFAVPR
jgi:general secretion pathway protein J